MQVEETTYYLEMNDPTEAKPSKRVPESVSLQCAQVPSAELSRFFYTAVGGDWFWVDRLEWTYDDWRQYVSRPECETWILTASGTPAGYFELDGIEGADIEIAYFGLLPQFIGNWRGMQPFDECAKGYPLVVR